MNQANPQNEQLLSQNPETICYEDEIDLVDYFRVLWKRKWLILCGTLLPTFLVGLVLYLLPRTYRISYTYDRSLTAKEFQIIKQTFFSKSNLDTLTGELQSSGFSGYAQQITSTQMQSALEQLIQFEMFPSLDLSGAKTIEELQKLQQAKSSLLTIHIYSPSRSQIRPISRICRMNFEQQIPMLSIRNSLNKTITDFREKMAVIEDARYNLNLLFEQKQSILTKLKKSDLGTSENLAYDVVLQFSDVADNSDYLPLSYQIQATTTQAIHLEEKIRENQQQYTYNEHLTDLYTTLFEYVTKNESSLTLKDYHAFLGTLAEKIGGAGESIKDSLNAYIKRIENQIVKAQPLTQTPAIYTIAKGATRKTGIVFGFAFIVSVFSAFIAEGLQKKGD